MTDDLVDVLPSHRRVVAQALETIQEHYAEELTIEALAKTSGYGRAYFAGIFKTITGKSPNEYIIELRFKEAERLLRETTLPLPVICNRVGYQATSTFSVRFRERYQFTPTEYRKRVRG